MTKPSSQYKYQDLKDYLIRQIQTGPQENGGQLESEPQLCRKFNLSRNTARQAMRELENEGYIYRIHGKGTFIRSETPARLRKIALLVYDTAYTAHPVTGALICGIGEVLEQNGYVLDILASRRSFHDESLKQLAASYAGFLIGSYQLDELTLRELKKIAKPWFFVKNYLPGYEEKALRIDFHHAGFLAAEYLVRTGCGNLALIYSGEGVAISRDFKSGVVDAALEHGVRLRRENIFSADYSGRTDVPHIVEELLEHSDRPDGIICASDELGAAVLEALGKRGVSVPREMAVIGCNNTVFGRLSEPALTTIDIHIDELGRLAAARIMELIAGREFTPQLLSPSCIIRASTNKESCS